MQTHPLAGEPAARGRSLEAMSRRALGMAAGKLVLSAAAVIKPVVPKRPGERSMTGSSAQCFRSPASPTIMTPPPASSGGFGEKRICPPERGTHVCERMAAAVREVGTAQ